MPNFLMVNNLKQGLFFNQLWLQQGAVTPIHSIQGDFNSISVSIPGMNARLHFNAVAHLPL